MKIIADESPTPLRLKRKGLPGGTHKYLIEIDSADIDILFKDTFLSDELFHGWFPFLALKIHNSDKIKLYQAEANGGLVEWLLELRMDSLHYIGHSFVNEIYLAEVFADSRLRCNHGLLSFDILSLTCTRKLVNCGFIINQDKLLGVMLRPSRMLSFDDQNLIRYLEGQQISVALATQVRNLLGPMIYACFENHASSLSLIANEALPEHVFATCSQRWESKEQLIRVLILSQANNEKYADINRYQHTHLFSYSPQDQSWVCHCIKVANPKSSASTTIYLVESGEAGLISAAYIAELDVLIVSPHSKNGDTDHDSAISRIATAASSFCGTSSLSLDGRDHKEPSCVLLSLTNCGNLYHLVANDLYGVFACLDFMLESSILPFISIGKGHAFLPVSIQLDHFAYHCFHDSIDNSRNSSDNIGHLVDMPCGPSITKRVLTLAKAPYCLSKNSLARYRGLINSASQSSPGLAQLDLRSCNLKNINGPLLNSDANIIIFGIRCARRKPVNQLQMLEAIVSLAEECVKDTIIIIEGTYSMTGTKSEMAFIAEEASFIEKARIALHARKSESVRIFSFVGKSTTYSTCSAFLDATVIAPWGAGLTRHMFFAEKRYLVHTNLAVHAGMAKTYYSWETPYPPKTIKYLDNYGDDMDCTKNEEVLRLDPLRPNWSIFNDYTVNIEGLVGTLKHVLINI